MFSTVKKKKNDKWFYLKVNTMKWAIISMFMDNSSLKTPHSSSGCSVVIVLSFGVSSLHYCFLKDTVIGL